VISDEDERVRETKRTEADWEGDLGGFVDDAVVELSTSEDRTVRKRAKSASRREKPRRTKGELERTDRSSTPSSQQPEET